MVRPRFFILLSLSLVVSAIPFKGMDPSFEGERIKKCGKSLMRYIIDLEMSMSCSQAAYAFAPLPAHRIRELENLHLISNVCCYRPCSDREIYEIMCQ